MTKKKLIDEITQEQCNYGSYPACPGYSDCFCYSELVERILPILTKAQLQKIREEQIERDKGIETEQKKNRER